MTEPKAWYDPEVTDRDVGLSWTPGQFHTQPLYTAPPAAQPVQEPVAWWVVSKTTGKKSVISQPNDWPDVFWEKHALYTTPPSRPWVGLTDEEIAECFKITPDQYLPWRIYKRIEAKLKEKNMGSFTEDQKRS